MNPNQGIVLVSFVISLVAALAVWLFGTEVGLPAIVGAFVLVFLTSWFSILAFTRRYISEKLLPIYRIMFGANMKDIPNKFDIASDPVKMAQKDSSDWADERIEEIRNLQEKDDYRKEFIGNLAHELKTPLFNIQGYVNSLLEGAMEDDNVRERFIEKANKNVDRIVRIVEDLDTISHLEFDRLDLEKSRMNIVDCASEVLDSLEIQAADREVELIMTQREPIHVLGDEFRIGQVLVNLVNNAIAYGKKGGKVEIMYSDLADHVLIEVIDDGPGIDPEKLPRIFERFYRVDKSRSRDDGGSGLGLAIVKHILEGHGQTIRVKSEVGAGSRFSFTLNKA